MSRNYFNKAPGGQGTPPNMAWAGLYGYQAQGFQGQYGAAGRGGGGGGGYSRHGPDRASEYFNNDDRQLPPAAHSSHQQQVARCVQLRCDGWSSRCTGCSPGPSHPVPTLPTQASLRASGLAPMVHMEDGRGTTKPLTSKERRWTEEGLMNRRMKVKIKLVNSKPAKANNLSLLSPSMNPRRIT